MTHSCPDGTHTKLTRNGPIGTVEGVMFSCPRCGYSRSAKAIWTDSQRILSSPEVRDWLASR